jgi:hypothetical protein
VNEPIKKWLFLTASLMPFVIINPLLIFACYLFPHYVHYLTIILAFHVGMCVSDMISVKNVLFAPKGSFIEENDDGIEILIKNNAY